MLRSLQACKLFRNVLCIFSLNWPLGQFSHRVAMSVCLFDCASVNSRNTHFRRLWRLLILKHIPNIGLKWRNKKIHNFIQFFIWPPLPYRLKSKTLTSRCRGDFGSKNLFLILVSVNIRKNASILFLKKYGLTCNGTIKKINASNIFGLTAPLCA